MRVRSLSREEVWASAGVITKGPMHRGANGVAMPTDEDNQDDHLFFNHPKVGATSPPRHTQHPLLLFRSNPH